MRRVILLAGLVLAIGVLLPGSAFTAVGGSDLPFTGSQAGYDTTDLTTLPVAHTHIVTTGEVSHFGLATAEQHVELVFTGPANFTSTGTWTLTAANGDQMFGTSTGSGFFTDAVHATILATYTSTGGNGRFEDASLTFTASGHVTRISLVGGISTAHIEATIVDGQLSYR